MVREYDSQGADEQRASRALTSRRRADTYRLLADVFNAEPTAQMLDSLRRLEVAKAFEALGATFAAELERTRKLLDRRRSLLAGSPAAVVPGSGEPADDD